MNQLMTIEGVRGYIDANGTAQLNLEDVSRGLGFVETKGGYIRWQRVEGYLSELGFSTSGERPEYIPENIFYRLAMKAKNEAAEAFQAKVADEILPTIRKTGGYAADPLAGASPELRAILMVDRKTQLIESRVDQMETKLDEQITLDSGEARRLQKAISKRVYELADTDERRPELFRELHREIKDRWEVPSYHDVKRKEFLEALRYVEAWRPLRKNA